MFTNKLTTNARATVPQPVRAALGVKAGEMVYEIDEQCVIHSRVIKAAKPDDPFGTYHDWHSEADKKAYGRLWVERCGRELLVLAH